MELSKSDLINFQAHMDDYDIPEATLMKSVWFVISRSAAHSQFLVKQPMNQQQHWNRRVPMQLLYMTQDREEPFLG